LRQEHLKDKKVLGFLDRLAGAFFGLIAGGMLIAILILWLDPKVDILKELRP
jgi:uncharacterized membrane protein required for colicin V production